MTAPARASPSSQGTGTMEGAPPILDSLMEVFPQVNLLTLIEVSIQFTDDIDAAADHIIQNVLPNTPPHPSHPNMNEDLFDHGLQQASDDTSNHLGIDPVDNSSNSDVVQSYLTNEIIVNNELKQSLTYLSSDASTSGEDHTSEGFSSNSVLAGSQLRHNACETNTEISASDSDMPLHNNGSPDVIMRSNYSVNLLESLDDVIADEQHKKVTLLSNAAAISEMLQEVELNEEKTKHAISAMNEAGNDILRKVDELKEMTTLVMEDNNKMAGEIYAENSILATEAQELQTRLFNISEETKNFELTIEQMNHTLQRGLAASEEERAAAKKAQLEREASAQKILREQQLSLEAANQKFRWLEEQAKENAKLKELLVDRGHAVDALHGEMLGIFDSITELKLKVDKEFPAVESQEQVSSSLPSSAVFFKCPFSAVDELLQQDSSSLGSAIDVPQQPVSSDSFVKSASAKSVSIESASLKCDEKIINISDDKFALDDSWDVVGDDDEVVCVPANPLYTADLS